MKLEKFFQKLENRYSKFSLQDKCLLLLLIICVIFDVCYHTGVFLGSIAYSILH